MSIRNWFGSVLEWLRDLFRGRPPGAREGHFVVGSKMSWRGWLAHSPWVAPSRDYLLYVPANYRAWRGHSLVVWLHGCKQSPEEFAAGTRIAEEADARGMFVLLPRQSSGANMEGCWNWFDPATSAGYGEAAIVLAQIAEVRKQYRINASRVYVGGMSSGGAFAAALAIRHPDRFAGVAIHSGAPCGAGSSAWSAAQALRVGPNTDVERIARVERARAPRRALPLPAMIIHGADDARVHPANSRRLVTQFLTLNGDARGAAEGEPVPDDVDRIVDAEGAHTYDVQTFRAGKRTLVQFITVHGLAHAWSGGDPSYAYHVAHGPDATSLMLDFLLGGKDVSRNLAPSAVPVTKES